MFEIIYKARLTQSGENPPKICRLDEGIKGTYWTRSAPGTYHFKRDRTFFKFNNSFPGNTVTRILENGDKVTYTLTDRNEFTVKTFHASDLDTPVDGILNKFKFKLAISREELFL